MASSDGYGVRSSGDNNNILAEWLSAEMKHRPQGRCSQVPLRTPAIGRQVGGTCLVAIHLWLLQIWVLQRVSPVAIFSQGALGQWLNMAPGMRVRHCPAGHQAQEPPSAKTIVRGSSYVSLPSLYLFPGVRPASIRRLSPPPCPSPSILPREISHLLSPLGFCFLKDPNSRSTETTVRPGWYSRPKRNPKETLMIY